MSDENSNIVEESLNSLENEDDLFGEDLPDMGMQYRDVDYNEQLQNAHDHAREVVDSLLRFYFDQDFIEESQYLRYKQNTAQQTLSQLKFLMETGREVMIKLMQNIDSGDMAPRMFEVLSQLQKSQLEIVQNYSKSIVAAEEEARRVLMENEATGQLDSDQGGPSTGGNGLTTNDPRELMKAMEEGRKEEVEPEKDLDEVTKEVKDKSERLKPEEEGKQAEIENMDDAEYEELDNF